jgi:hypothetical protein
MADRGAPLGNNNAGKAKPWAGAIRRALAEEDRDGLLELARVLIAKGKAGDMAALKEIGDRSDGKAPQPVVGDDSFDPVRLVVTPTDAQL